MSSSAAIAKNKASKSRPRLFPKHTKLYKRIKQYIKPELEHIDIVALQGGTESSKTYSILQLLCKLAILQLYKKPDDIYVITVFGETINNLKKGALRDFKRLILSSPLLKAALVNPDSEAGPYKFVNGSVIEFVSYETAQSAQSGKRYWSYAYEVKGIPKDIFDEVETRTDYTTFACFNPTAKFWMHKVYGGDPRCTIDISTYLDNEFASPKRIRTILSWKKKWKKSQAFDIHGKLISESNHWKNKWKVHGEGQTGSVQGVIYENINWITDMPSGLKFEAYCLDFGYIHPTALSRVGMKFGNINAEQLLYKTGLTNEALVKELGKLGINKRIVIIADNADPKGIATLRNAGYLVKEANKYPGSKKDMIDLLLDANVNITRASEDWQEEQENYKWKVVRGETKEEPIDGHDHLFDGLGYYALEVLSPLKIKKPKRRSRRMRRRRAPAKRA